MKKIVFTFGRYNPPTSGHAELIMYAVKLAQRKGADHRIYTSQSHDPSKNPLSPRQKMAFLRQIFPGVNFVDDPSMKTAFAICKKLADEGYEDVTFVVGDDRVADFRTQLTKYVKPRTAKDFNPKIHYPFKHFQVVSSGARKRGISGTDLRNAVRKGDFATFMKSSAAKDRTLARKIFDVTRSQLNEQTLSESVTRKDFNKLLNTFVEYTCKQLNIKEPPSLHYKDDKGEGQPSFGGYSPSEKKLMVYTKNRHPMDILRTVAHELVHHKQNEDGRLGKDVAKEGATGSDIENEANSEAGKVMRYFGRENPFYFDMSYVTENRAIIFAGTPGSGKDRILKEAILPLGFTEISADVFHKADINESLIVVNGTGNDIEKTRVIKEALELRGYRTMMVFVNTTNEVSKLRNEARVGKGRVITESVRFGKWKDAQFNASEYATMFEQYYEFNNSIDLDSATNREMRLYNNQLSNLSENVSQFIKSDADINFENMLSELDTSRMPMYRNIIDKRSSAPETITGRDWRGRSITTNRTPGASSTSQTTPDSNKSGSSTPSTPGTSSTWSQTHRGEGSSPPVTGSSTTPDSTFQRQKEKDTSSAPSTYSNVNVKYPLNGSPTTPKSNLNEVGGAGNWGTTQLTDRYKKDTPGEEPGGIKVMKVLDTSKRNKEGVPSDAKALPMPRLPIGADRIGPEAGFPKEPSFGDNQTMPFSTMYDPIGRWMVKEETRRRFKEKYGQLAEQKLKETAMRVAQRESLDDPYSSFTGATPGAWGAEDQRPIGANQADAEKQSLFGIRIRRLRKNKKAK